MIFVALAIALSVAAGIAAQRRWDVRVEQGVRSTLLGLLYTVVPVVVFVNLARLEIDADNGGGILIAWAALVLAGLVAYVVATRVLRLRRNATGMLIITTMQANTGFLGTPVVVAVLGGEHLGEAVAYDTLVNAPFFLLACFAVAAAFGDAAGEGVRERVRAFFVRNPPLLAVAFAFVVPDAWVPDVAVDITRVFALGVLPVGFFALGVTLAAEAGRGRMLPPLTTPVVTAVALRVIIAPTLLLLLALPLIDLPSAYLLTSAMASGINGIVLAHVYGLDLGLAAGAIAWSTIVVVPLALVASVLT